ncbi:MAG: hypothetical protein ACRD3J_17765 [Thermoanaerobaculia bacterium]
MRSRVLIITFFSAVTALAAPPPKAIVPKTLAPATIPHPMALYLARLSKDGKQQVAFRAQAVGTHFFLEEPSGVTVYNYDPTAGYQKETFLKGYTLSKALRRYK